MGRVVGVRTIDGEEIVCSKCGIRKPLSEYYKSTLTNCKLAFHCKECHKAEKREIYSKTRAKPKGVYYKPEYGRLMEHRGYGTRIFLNKDQIDWLKRNFAETKNEELAAALGVSLRTMIRRARELGLTKSKSFMIKASQDAALIAKVNNKRYGNSGMRRKGMPFMGNQYVKIVNNEQIKRISRT